GRGSGCGGTSVWPRLGNRADLRERFTLNKGLAMKSLFSLIGPLAIVCSMTLGCGSSERKNHDFFTSGNREADQRAEQRMSKDLQLKDTTGKNAQANADVKKA